MGANEAVSMIETWVSAHGRARDKLLPLLHHLQEEIGYVDDRLVPVRREPGTNSAHLVVGLVSNPTEVVPEGMQRVMLLSDPTQGLGNLAEPECRRVNAALVYAAEHRLPKARGPSV